MSRPVLRDYQLDVIERLRARMREGRRRLVLQAPTGAGKCLAPGTPVLMFDGTIRAVEGVSTGDQLMGPDSAPRTVLSTCSGMDHMYRIVPTKGTPYVVNEPHVLSLKLTPDRPGDRHEVVNLPVASYLRQSATFRHRAKGWRAAVTWPERPVPLDPYFLGLWLGDGSLAAPTVSKPDQEVGDFMAAFAASHGLALRERRYAGKCPQWSAVGRPRAANPVMALLRCLGVTARRFVPHAYKANSRRVRLAVLAGLLDSDGSLANGGFDFVSASQGLADDVAFLCRSLGLAAYVAPCRKGCQTGAVGLYYRVSISGDCSVVPTQIARKQAAPRRQVKDVTVTGVRVEPAGFGPYHGFELDGDRLFLLGDFTVTHNTTCSSEIVRCAVAKGKRVLFLAHRRRLIDQKARRLADFGVPHGVLMRGAPRRPEAPVQVASRDTLLSRAVRNEWIAPPPADLVITDECHNAMAQEYQKLLGMYPQAVHIGLTATPATGGGAGLGGFFEALECTVPVSRLIREGWLVPVRCYAPQVAGRHGKRQLAGDPVAHWRRLAEGRPTVLFAAKVEASLAVQAAFVAAGVPAEHIDAHTPDEERDAVIARVESGATKVLCNVGVMTEGVDIPCLSCCVLLRLAGSYVLYAQAVGRVMRAHPGKEDAVLLDHSDAVLEHGFPDEDVSWTLDEGDTVDRRNKKDKKEGKRKEPVACPACGYLYSGAVVCPACGHRLPRRLMPPSLRSQLLAEVDRQGDPAVLREMQVRYWHSCLARMANLGRVAGAAAHMYRSRFGCWPDEGLPNLPHGNQWRQRVCDLFPQYVRTRSHAQDGARHR